MSIDSELTHGEEKIKSLALAITPILARLGESSMKLSCFKILLTLATAPDCWFTIAQVSRLSGGKHSRIPISQFDELIKLKYIKLSFDDTAIDFTSSRYLFSINAKGFDKLNGIVNNE